MVYLKATTIFVICLGDSGLFQRVVFYAVECLLKISLVTDRHLYKECLVLLVSNGKGQLLRLVDLTEDSRSLLRCLNLFNTMFTTF